MPRRLQKQLRRKLTAWFFLSALQGAFLQGAPAQSSTLQGLTVSLTLNRQKPGGKLVFGRPAGLMFQVAAASEAGVTRLQIWNASRKIFDFTPPTPRKRLTLRGETRTAGPGKFFARAEDALGRSARTDPICLQLQAASSALGAADSSIKLIPYSLWTGPARNWKLDLALEARSGFKGTLRFEGVRGWRVIPAGWPLTPKATGTVLLRLTVEPPQEARFSASFPLTVLLGGRRLGAWDVPIVPWEPDQFLPQGAAEASVREGALGLVVKKLELQAVADMRDVKTLLGHFFTEGWTDCKVRIKVRRPPPMVELRLEEPLPRRRGWHNVVFPFGGGDLPASSVLHVDASCAGLVLLGGIRATAASRAEGAKPAEPGSRKP